MAPRLGLPAPLRRYRHGVARRVRGPISLVQWYASGRPDPPPQALKHRVLVGYARTYGLAKFVETGTYVGETAAVLAKHVSAVVTVELSPGLVELSRRNLRRLDNVSVRQGDSAQLLPSILGELDEPALFWLDGHYSEGITARGDEDTPIRSELEAILVPGRERDVIVIDDARCFTGGAYPSLSELEEQVHRLAPRYRIEVRHDMIRLLPPASIPG